MKNKVAIITGASSGIGKALAFEFARRGAKVVIAARSFSKLEEIHNALLEMGADAWPVVADVSSETDCRNLTTETIKKYGRIDILVNNAGVSMRALFEDCELEVIRRLMDVNFWGTVCCTKYALPYLLESKGSVVGVVSIAGYVGLPGRTGYSASKYAIRGFLDTLRVENLYKGLHVMVVAPGFTSSNIRNVALTANGSQQGETPRDESKMMSAEKVANKIANGIEKRRRSLVLTFVEGKLTVFLGKWLPRLLDRLAYSHMAKEPNSPFK
ncbi:MAG: SDR family oxidoreductase [Bacteroidota bacterium]|nr:SDR family oxidoreductase [Bacteroidota bacterium]